MGIAERKAELERDIARTENRIARQKRRMAELDALPDFEVLADGTVVALAVTIARSRAYTYVGFKTGGQWYLTGKNSPNGVSSDDLADWLTSGPHRLDTALVLAELETVQVATVDLGEVLDGLLNSIPMGRASSYPGDEFVREYVAQDERARKTYYGE